MCDVQSPCIGLTDGVDVRGDKGPESNQKADGSIVLSLPDRPSAKLGGGIVKPSDMERRCTKA
jgi:hypothetical protein